MAIKINDIPAEGLSIKLTDKLDVFDKGAATTEFSAVLGIKPAGQGVFHMTGRVQAAPILECSRCLTIFSYGIDAEFDVDLVPLSSLEPTPEHELVKGELDMEFYHGDEIDPLDFIKEQLLIAVPMVPLHRPDCKGLCNVCGTDLNKDDCGHRQNRQGDFGPFAGLKDLLKK